MKNVLLMSVVVISFLAVGCSKEAQVDVPDGIVIPDTGAVVIDEAVLVSSSNPIQFNVSDCKNGTCHFLVQFVNQGGHTAADITFKVHYNAAFSGYASSSNQDILTPQSVSQASFMLFYSGTVAAGPAGSLEVSFLKDGEGHRGTLVIPIQGI